MSDDKSNEHDDDIRTGIPRAFRLDVIGRDARRKELDEEIAFHLESRVAQLMRTGLSEEAARAEAVARFAGAGASLDAAIEQMEMERSRHGRRLLRREMFADMIREVRMALRSLGRAPVFTTLAVLTLGLGIGASTAIFSVVRGIVLRPLPYRPPEQLVHLRHETMPSVAPAAFLDWQRSSRTLQQVAAAQYWTPSVANADRSEEVDAIRVTDGMLQMLGVRMAAGRAFTPDEWSQQPTQSVVLSYDYWQDRFGGAASAIGATLLINGGPHTVVGVMPGATPFVPFWAENAQFAVPLVLGSRINDRDTSSLRVLARLRDDVTLAEVRAELDVIARRLTLEHPGSTESIELVPLHQMVVGNITRILYGLLAAVGCVLLIACANVAHLQLMRNATRGREFAIRAAIGGTRAHLLRQSLLEGAVLTIAATAVGLLLAWYGIGALLALAPDNIPRLDAVHMDTMVLVFAAGISIVVALLFGLLPSILATRVDLQGALREGGTAGEGRRRARLRSLLVVTEFAMALVLLTTAGLVVRTVQAMNSVDPGFDKRNLLSVRVSLRGTEDSLPSRRGAFFRELSNRVALVGGVEAVGMVNHLPIHGDRWNLGYIVDGNTSTAEGSSSFATFRIARSGYFEAMRIPLVEGRGFTAEDEASSTRVVVINETMATREWVGGSAIGKRISMGTRESADWFTVIGVVRDVRQSSWTESAHAEMYFPHLTGSVGQSSPRGVAGMLNPMYMTLVVRTATDPLLHATTIASTVRDINPNVALSSAVTMEKVIDDEFAISRFYLTVFGAFATVAVSLALIGVYGVLSYSVARRMREIGLRLALGASTADAFRLVIWQGLRYVVVGATAGVVISLMLTRLIQGLLYGVEPADPLTLAAATLLLGAVAVIGCSIPAWRASRVDPTTALRAP